MINACYNCVDVHMQTGNGNKVAIIHVDNEGNEVQRLTYKDMLEQVERFAGLLVKVGVSKGDRVLIIMPDIPEVVIAMLGCARIGAVHVVAFASLTATQIAKRIDHLEPKVIVTASCAFTNVCTIQLKQIVDKAIDIATFKTNMVFVYQRKNSEAELNSSRDLDWRQGMKTAKPECCAILKSTDILYILYTSGTTGPLKGIMKDHGGHTVAAKWFMREIMGLRQGERFFSTVKMGGLASHTLQTYGVLLNGGTTIMCESGVSFEDDSEIFFRILDRYEVAVAFTLFYKLRRLKNQGNQTVIDRKRFPMKRLRAIYAGGERVEPETVQWLTEKLRIPITNQWGQTETSIAATSYSAELGILPSPSNYSSSGKELPGWNVKIVREDTHEECKNDEYGRMILQLPLPPGSLLGVYKDGERFKKYFSEFEGFYDTGDIAKKDRHGFVTVKERVDSLINVGAIKVSPTEVEQVISRHPLVVDQCIVGKKHCIRGYVLVGFLVLKNELSFEEFRAVSEQVKRMAHDEIGKHICLEECIQVHKIPKTKTGKNIREVLENFLHNRHQKEVSEGIITSGEIMKEVEMLHNNKNS